MGKSVSSLKILNKLDELFSSEDFTYDSTYDYIWWTGVNYKITLDWNANTVEVEHQFSKNKVIFKNTFWKQDSTGIDEWELHVDKFIEKIVEVINSEVINETNLVQSYRNLPFNIPFYKIS